MANQKMLGKNPSRELFYVEVAVQATTAAEVDNYFINDIGITPKAGMQIFLGCPDEASSLVLEKQEDGTYAGIIADTLGLTVPA